MSLDKIYILMGGPASGKGTRSKILANALNIPHIATGDMLRLYDGDKEIKDQIALGGLVPDETVNKILVERISNEDCVKGFVLDGYPRTEKQAIFLDEFLASKGKKVGKVLELQVSDELAFKRILGRQKCETCRADYGIDFPPRIKNVCDKCSGHLNSRDDDTKETLAVRINTYKKNSEPILEYYRKRGILHTVDSTSNPETVVDDAKL